MYDTRHSGQAMARSTIMNDDVFLYPTKNKDVNKII